MTNTEYPTFAVGDRVVIQNRGGGWDGVTGVIETAKGEGKNAVYFVKYDDQQSSPLPDFAGGNWTAGEYGYLSLLAPAAPSTGSPKASLTHETSRAYAAHATSRLLDDWVNDVLNKAADGEEVDVVTFRKAATQALSLAATRAGQSPIRRRWTREARHLIYWADAILDNHIKGLPIYEGGPRSPRISDLEGQVDALKEDARKAWTENSNLKQAASDERRRLVSEIDDLKAAVHEAEEQIDRARRSESVEVERTTALIKEKTALEVQVEDLLQGRTNDLKAIQHLYSEINEYDAALEYAFGLLSEQDKNRLAGFRDGYATRVNDEA
jgi:hypothetical protein